MKHDSRCQVIAVRTWRRRSRSQSECHLCVTTPSVDQLNLRNGFSCIFTSGDSKMRHFVWNRASMPSHKKLKSSVNESPGRWCTAFDANQGRWYFFNRHVELSTNLDTQSWPMARMRSFSKATSSLNFKHFNRLPIFHTAESQSCECAECQSAFLFTILHLSHKRPFSAKHADEYYNEENIEKNTLWVSYERIDNNITNFIYDATNL